MAIYHFKDSSVIDRVEVRTLREDISQATIVAKDGADAKELEKIRVLLGRHKLSTMMDSVDGHAAIQVRGLKNAQKLFSYLGEEGLTQGGARKELTAADHRHKEKVTDRVRGKALFLSALFYDLGNISYIISGFHRLHLLNKAGPGVVGADFAKRRASNISEMMIGATFGVGDLLMTYYGQDKGDEELDAVSMALKKHLHQKGIRIPQGDALTPDSLYHSGAFKATDRWLRRHIGQVKCLTEAVAGLFTIGSAIEPGNLNRGKLIAGMLLVSGWFSTFLLDKPRGHEIFGSDKKGDRMLDRIMDDPRAYIAGPFSMGNNVSNLIGALGPNGERVRFGKDVTKAEGELAGARAKADDIRSDITAAEAGHVLIPGLDDQLKAAEAKIQPAEATLAYAQSKKNIYGWNVFTGCSFLIANSLFRLSGGKHRPHDTEDDKRMMSDLVTLSANVLSRLPEPASEKVIDDTANYVANLSHVTLQKSEIADAIRAKVKDLSQTAWAQRIQKNSSPPSLST